MTKFKAETRGGYVFTLYAPNAGGDRPVHGRLVAERGEIIVHDWPENGSWRGDGMPHPYDIIPLREPSMAAIVAAANAYAAAGFVAYEAGIIPALLAAYEIDFPEGGK